MNLFTGTISLTSYAKNYPIHEIDFVNGVATKWRGTTLSWEDYTGDSSVTGNTRIWRYRLDSTSGNESHLACSKILLGSNSLSATISSTGTVENITSDENAFAWFYIGDNKNLFFFNGRYYDAQPKITQSPVWVQWGANNNYKSGVKYTLNTSTGELTTSTGGALNFSDFEFANTSLTINDYVLLTDLKTTDGGSTSASLYYWNGKFYTSAPKKKKGSSTWEQVSNNDNFKTCTLINLNSNSGPESYGTYYLFLSSGKCCQWYQNGGSGTTYNLSNSNTQYAILSIGNSTVYYFQGKFYNTAPTPYSTSTEENHRVTDSDVDNSKIMEITEGFYGDGGRILNKYGGSQNGYGNSAYWTRSFGNYTLGTATRGGNTDKYWNPSSEGPYIGYTSGGAWSYGGDILSDNATIHFVRGDGNDSVFARITTITYHYFTAPSPSYYYYIDGTYTYTTPEGVNYRIIFSSGKFSSHDYEKTNYNLSAPDTLANSTYYYTSGSYNNRIVISDGEYTSHEYKSTGYKYKYEAQGNFLNGEFITNKDEYASIYKYIFSDGYFSRIQVQKETTNQTEHSFSTPSSGAYTNFYMWTKTADISTSSTGSPSGQRNLLFKNKNDGKIELYFDSSGHLIKIKSMGATDYTDFLMFRCRSKWDKDTKWNDDFGLVFINGYLLKTNTTLSN